jgi:hemerythrin
VFAVGHDVLDAEHRGLMEIINKLCAAVLTKLEPEELRAVADELRRATKIHFRHENAVLKKIGADMGSATQSRRFREADLIAMTAAALRDHVAEHGRALTSLESILRPCRAGSGELAHCAELKDWFVQHAIKHDAHIKAILQAS